jgi:hypothetical protein
VVVDVWLPVAAGVGLSPIAAVLSLEYRPASTYEK